MSDNTYKIAVNRMATGKLPQGDPRWASFNDAFENMELPVIEIANYIFMGHAYTTWCDGRRSLENFICGQHIALDFDTGDERSDIEQLSQHEFIRTYGGLIHTTPSHTADNPRARVIFFLDQPITDANGYAAAATFLIDQFDGTDGVCKDASRFFYGARDCEISLIMNELPVSHLRTFYQRWKKTQPTRHPVATRREQPYQAPANISTDPTDKLATAQRALEKLRPWDIDYSEWIGVLAALHDEIGDEALPMAVQWADGKPGEVERKWRTFGKYGGDKASLGKVIWLAQNR